MSAVLTPADVRLGTTLRDGRKVCAPHGREFAWPHAVGCEQCCKDAAETLAGMAPNGGWQA